MKKSLRVAVTGSRHAIAAPDQNRNPRHGRLINRHQRTGAGPDGPGTLCGAANEKSGIVHEVHHGNVERVAKIDQANHLVACGSVRSAAAVPRIVCDDSYRIAVQPREPGRSTTGSRHDRNDGKH